MAEKTTFDLIKKQNGEAFAKAIHSYDNGIFDVPGIVDIVKYAGREAEPIMEYLVSLKNIAIKENGEIRSAEELLSEAGYNAYYADTLEKQNAIAPYFQKGEKLCTFGDNTRYQKYYIINAVRKDVDEIKREDFPEPKREDRYGTSVLSIQILKEGGFISIKNRYNHAVMNPDNTFSSNPDNIIQGLSEALKKQFNVDFSSQKNANVPEGYTVLNNRVFKYHREVLNTYFGDSFWIKDGKVHELNKDYQIMCDTFVLDLKEGKMYSPVSKYTTEVMLNEELKDKKLSVRIDKENKIKSIYMEEELFMKVKADGSQILFLNLPTTTDIPAFAFQYNHIKTLRVPQLQFVGNEALNGGIDNIMTPHEVVVEGDLSFSGKGMTQLPDLSKFIINGDFNCEHNNLTSLKGVPQQISGDLNCSYNCLKTFDFFPKSVRSVFCSDNQLTSLTGINRKDICGSFHCSNNQLESLEGAPKVIWGNFKCDGNNLVSLEGGPQIVEGTYDCSENKLTSLKGVPEEINGNFFCKNNLLTSFTDGPKKVHGNINCSQNRISSLNDVPEVSGSFIAHDTLLPPDRQEIIKPCKESHNFSIRRMHREQRFRQRH